VSVLLCSHLLDEVAGLCDRALVLERGRLVLEQTLASPADIAPVAECFDRLAAGEEGGAPPSPAGRGAAPASPGAPEGPAPEENAP
jgi:energy-coupling factor transporter ATP-binding protein EcfA2